MNLSRRTSLAVVPLLVFVSSFSSVAEASIYVTGNDLDSSRSSPISGGLTGTKKWGQGGFTLDWEIAKVANSDLWNYLYTVTRSGNGEISHWIIELSYEPEQGLTKDFWQDVFDDPDITPDADVEVAYFKQSFLPGRIFGVKFDLLEDVVKSTVSFSVAQAPVWGDFFAKGGGPWGSVWNAGFSEGVNDQGGPAHGTTNFTNWVPRPNGAQSAVVPEAAALTIWTVLVGCTGLIVVRRQRDGR